MTAHRVLVIAEGRSEIGDLDALVDIGTKRRAKCEGYIPPMLRQLLERPVQIDAQRIVVLRGPKRRLPGHGERAAMALALASAESYAVLVFVKDVDRTPGVKRSHVERRRKLKEMHEQIDRGFAAVHDANVICVKATPCRMIEAWALGDEKAIGAVGAKAARLSLVPPRPEEAWGDERDPDSSHPKCLLRRALGRAPDAEALEAIACESRPTRLRKTCPESFAPFADEVIAARLRLTDAST